jgi:hypothetical protein
MGSFAFQPGDVLAFHGTGVMSRLIELATWGPSHVGMIAEWGGEKVMVESTSLCTRPCLIRGTVVHGVQVHYPEERITDYNGAAELYRLVPLWSLSESESALLTRILQHLVNEHVGYDFSRAALSGTRVLKWLEYPDPGSQFCSELIAGMVMRLGRFPISNPAAYNPAGLIRTLQSTGVAEKIPLRKMNRAA